jgi:hypothetical protein
MAELSAIVSIGVGDQRMAGFRKNNFRRIMRIHDSKQKMGYRSKTPIKVIFLKNVM